MDRFKFLEHTADIKFQAFGKTLEETFVNSLHAIVNVITKDNIKPLEKKIVKVKARDREGLLYDFLERVIYLLDVGGFIPGVVEEIKIYGDYVVKNGRKLYNYFLEAVLVGDDINNYESHGDIKAITFNEMFIKTDELNNDPSKRFTAQVVIDV